MMGDARSVQWTVLANASASQIITTPTIGGHYAKQCTEHVIFGIQNWIVKKTLCSDTINL